MAAWLAQTLQLSEPGKLDREQQQLEPDAHGLTIHSTPLAIARAALEAVVFQVSRVYDQLVHALPAQASLQRGRAAQLGAATPGTGRYPQPPA